MGHERQFTVDEESQIRGHSWQLDVNAAKMERMTVYLLGLLSCLENDVLCWNVLGPDISHSLTHSLTHSLSLSLSLSLYIYIYIYIYISLSLRRYTLMFTINTFSRQYSWHCIRNWYRVKFETYDNYKLSYLKYAITAVMHNIHLWKFVFSHLFFLMSPFWILWALLAADIFHVSHVNSIFIFKLLLYC